MYVRRSEGHRSCFCIFSSGPGATFLAWLSGRVTSVGGDSSLHITDQKVLHALALVVTSSHRAYSTNSIFNLWRAALDGQGSVALLGPPALHLLHINSAVRSGRLPSVTNERHSQ